MDDSPVPPAPVLMDPGDTRSWIRRHWVVSGLAVVLALGASGALIDDDDTGPTAAASSRSETASAPVDEVQPSESSPRPSEVQSNLGPSVTPEPEPTVESEPTLESEPTAEPAPTFEPEPPGEQAPRLTRAQENAIRSAESYLKYSSFSRTGLIDQLEFEGFTPVQARFGVDSMTVSWRRQAELKAEEYLEYSSFSRSGLIDQLEFEGFTPDEARHGVNQAGL